MKRTNGYTLIFVIGVIALLAGLAAMLAGPSVQQQRRVDLHYRKIQAEYLSLAGIERAKEWRSQGVVTNALYLLANGTVDVRMEHELLGPGVEDSGEPDLGPEILGIGRDFRERLCNG